MARVVLAFVSFPLVFGALYILGAAAQGSIQLSGGKYVAIWYALVTYTLAFVVALPLLWISLRNGWVSWWHAAIAGPSLVSSP